MERFEIFDSSQGEKEQHKEDRANSRLRQGHRMTGTPGRQAGEQGRGGHGRWTGPAISTETSMVYQAGGRKGRHYPGAHRRGMLNSTALRNKPFHCP